MMTQSFLLDQAVRRAAEEARNLFHVSSGERLDIVRIIEDACFQYASEGYDFEIVSDEDRIHADASTVRLAFTESDYEHAVAGDADARRTLARGFAAFLVKRDARLSADRHEDLAERLADELLMPSETIARMSAEAIAERFGVSVHDAAGRLSRIATRG